MCKYLWILVFALLTNTAIAQKKHQKVAVHDTVAYYMESEHSMANTEADAQFLRLIIKTEHGMFNIQDYYMDARPRLVATSSVGDIYFDTGLQGPYFEFYKTGKRRAIKKYNRGRLVGDEISYYTNGKPYSVKNYDKDTVYLKECYDSTGTVLAENGNGKWVNYNADFTLIAGEGQIANGKEEGPWKTWDNDGLVSNYVYSKGKIISGKQNFKPGEEVFQKVDVSPSFNGGDSMFGKYLGKGIQYPRYAIEHNIQGRVVLTFVAEKDGSITGVKVVKGVHPSIDEEALRAIKSMPLWNPGKINGQPVRVQYSVPVGFALAQN